MVYKRAAMIMSCVAFATCCWGTTEGWTATGCSSGGSWKLCWFLTSSRRWSTICVTIAFADWKPISSADAFVSRSSWWATVKKLMKSAHVWSDGSRLSHLLTLQVPWDCWSSEYWRQLAHRYYTSLLQQRCNDWEVVSIWSCCTPYRGVLRGNKYQRSLVPLLCSLIL